MSQKNRSKRSEVERRNHGNKKRITETDSGGWLPNRMKENVVMKFSCCFIIHFVKENRLTLRGRVAQLLAFDWWNKGGI